MTLPQSSSGPPAPALDRRVRLLARTYAARVNEVKAGFVGRDEAIDLVALATLSREHLLLVGPPGTAKSRLLDLYRQMLDARYFTYLLTRFTEPAELFGPVDVARFREHSIYQVNTTGMLPDAEIAFLDEVFQGSSAILNTLLSLINERVFHNGARPVSVPLVTLLGSSNEIPDDPVLAAFGDRFLLRCRLDYVADDDLEDVLELGWRHEVTAIRAAGEPGERGEAGAPPGRFNGGGVVAERAAVTPSAVTPSAVAPRFPVRDLKVLQQAVAGIDLTEIRGHYGRVVRALRAEGVAFSDRRAVKAQKIFAAAALLAGRSRAEVADLAPLVHLWTHPQDEATVRRVVADSGVPVDEVGQMVRDLAEIRFDLTELVGQRSRASGPEEMRALLGRGQRLAVELRRDHPAAADLLDEVQRAQREAVVVFRERFAEGGITYV